jgi:hypothetical protein
MLAGVPPLQPVVTFLLTEVPRPTVVCLLGVPRPVGGTVVCLLEVCVLF